MGLIFMISPNFQWISPQKKPSPSAAVAAWFPTMLMAKGET
jgi:hypothetical protein